ncbi:MAG: hypothetical protein KF687_16585 [Cyclobacteriaceae bacterium]|nr:hypothetical protein [Cyclobacteriaceae bacterium]
MTKKSKDLFFPLISLLLLAIVLKGFGPSFFFRNSKSTEGGFGPEGLPIYILIHGIVMSTWMLLLVVQTGLVQTKNIKVHMTLGWVGLAVALLVIPTGIMVMNGFGPRLLALGVPPPVLREGLSLLFWIDVFSLILFPSLFGAAIYYRKNSVWHKRFMLFAGFTVMLPALGRLTAQIAQTDSFGGINWPLTWGIFFCIMLSVPLYDFLSTRSIQRVTIISFISVSVGMLLSVQIAATEIGKDLASFHFLGNM